MRQIIHHRIFCVDPLLASSIHSTRSLRRPILQVAQLVLCLFSLNLLIVTSTPLLGAQPVSLDPNRNEYTLGKFVEYISTPGSELSINDLISHRVHVDWRDSQENVPSFGFSRDTHWLKFTINNPNPTAKSYFLELGYPMLDNVTLYIVAPGGSYVEYNAGRQLPFYQRGIDYHNFVFPVSFAAFEQRTFYLRSKTTSSLQFPLYLWSAEKFVAAKPHELYLLGIYTGLMMVMALYNLFIFFSLKDKNYLYYVLYISFHAFAQMSINGLCFQYLWPDHPNASGMAIIIALGFTGFWLSMFTTNFLQTAKQSKICHGILTAVKFWAFSITILAFFMPNDWMIKQCTLAVIVLFSTIFVTGTIALIKGFQPARLFLLAFFVFIVGALLMAFRTFGLAPTNFLTQYGVLIGSSLDILLLSLALGDRLNYLQNERNTAHTAAITSYQKQQIEVARRQQLELQNLSLEREIKNAAEQLIQIDKMAVLGQLVAGVAHDIGSPSQLIMLAHRDTIDAITSTEARIHALLDDNDDPEALNFLDNFNRELSEAKTSLGQLEKAIKRVSDIQSAILNQSRIDKTIDLIPVKSLIDECLIILRTKLHKWQVTVDCPTELMLRCKRSQIGQLFTNLLSNAADALTEHRPSHTPEDGKADIVIRVKKVTNQNGEEFTGIYVEDNGKGVAAEHAGRIFDPFYTTKQVGIGTGLGLSICRRIAESHGGRITLSTDKTLSGACFVVEFPVSTAKPQATTPPLEKNAA